MFRSGLIATAVLILFSLGGIGCSQNMKPSPPQNPNLTPRHEVFVPLQPLAPSWGQRVRATADHPQQARQVILDSIYANRSLEVALAYGKMYDQQPKSESRIANFGHAMAVAEVFGQQRGKELTVPYARAMQAIQAIVAPEQELPPDQQAQAALRQTKIADAWLAWGIYSIEYTMDYKSVTKIYNHALVLDPKFYEANYWLANMITAPYDKTYFDAHKQEAFQNLTVADNGEPKLHPLIVECRAAIALGAFDEKAAVPYLKESIRLWPNSPRVATYQKLIAQLEKSSQPKK